MTDDSDHNAPEDFDGALQTRYERLSLLTLDLAEEAGEAAVNFSLVDTKGAKPCFFDRRMAAMTRAIWAHQIIERLRRGRVIEQMRPHQQRPCGAEGETAAPPMHDGRFNHFSGDAGDPFRDGFLIGGGAPAMAPAQAAAAGGGNPKTTLNGDGFQSIEEPDDQNAHQEATLIKALRDPGQNIAAVIETLAADDIEESERAFAANKAPFSPP